MEGGRATSWRELAELTGVSAGCRCCRLLLHARDAPLWTLEFYVNEHSTKMPHPAFSGQTPDKMFFGTGAKVPEELALAKGNARAGRTAANRAMSCERCLGQQATLPDKTIPH